MKKDSEVTVGTLVLMVIALAVMIPGIIFSGYVMTILWGWFLTPAFGLAVPSIPLMLGISLLISYLTYQSINVEDTREPHVIFLTGIFYSLGRPLMTLLIGYIIHSYV